MSSEIIKRIGQKLIRKSQGGLNNTPENNTVLVENPHSDREKFQRSAFRRIPGVVNFSKSETETILRGARSLQPED